MVKTFREWLKLKEVGGVPSPAQDQIIGATVGAPQTGGTPNIAANAKAVIMNNPRLAAAIGKEPAFDRLMAIVNKNQKKIDPASQNMSALVPGNAGAAISAGGGV